MLARHLTVEITWHSIRTASESQIWFYAAIYWPGLVTAVYSTDVFRYTVPLTGSQNEKCFQGS